VVAALQGDEAGTRVIRAAVSPEVVIRCSSLNQSACSFVPPGMKASNEMSSTTRSDSPLPRVS
jgi:hypothetical protein